VVRYDFEKALEEFRAVETQLKTDNIREAIRIMEFWTERMKVIRSAGSDEETIKAWKTARERFEGWYNEQGLGFTEMRDQLRRLSLSKISDLLIARFQRLDVPDTGLLCELGETFLEMKDYPRASETLLYAVRLSRNNAEALALLSDAVYFQGDVSKSRLYLREAFLADCDAVPVGRLRSPLVKELKYLTEQEGHAGRDCQRWMPIVGTCLNIFDAKRPLSEEEAFRLEEECRDLEERISEDRRQEDSLRPLILFRTLALMDQVLLDGKVGGGRMAKYEIRLKRYDEKMYGLYVKNVFFHGEAP
jgi:tetratricopeptide (TPR) repeat protein